MISKAINLLLFVALLGFAHSANSATVEFAPDELPTESVVPVLDSNMAVKKKLIPFAGRFEVGFAYGTVIDEMFFNNSLMGFEAFYHVDEDYALGLKYQTRMSGNSTYSDQFSQSSQQLQFSSAPAPTTIMAATYRWSFLYGKVSFGKDFILPTVFYVDGDLGMNKYGGQDLPYTSVGLGQKLYSRKHWGLFLSYRFMFYQIIDPVSAPISAAQPKPSESDFDKKLQISQGLDLGLSYLF